jgi:Protein of unknown function (DUF3102)
MTDPSLSNSLTDLAARIRAEHEAVGVALKESVSHAIQAGEMLLEAKDKLNHGEWLPWLKDHCSLNERLAQRYMRIARNKAKYAGLSDLSITGALALLAPDRDDEGKRLADNIRRGAHNIANMYGDRLRQARDFANMLSTLSPADQLKARKQVGFTFKSMDPKSRRWLWDWVAPKRLKVWQSLTDRDIEQMVGDKYLYIMGMTGE